MSKIETDALNLIISNLNNFSSKADYLLVSKSNNFPDFFDQYREYMTYLKSLDFENAEIRGLIKKVPKIPASGFSLIKLLIILPFFLYLFVIQIYLLLFIWIPIILSVAIYFFINEKRKHKMAQIMIFNSRLIELLQIEIN